MACLLGRGGLLGPGSPLTGDQHAPEDSPNIELAVADDPQRIANEQAVFDALAHQVTAFICNLDEATVNCGAAEPRTIHLSSSSGSGSGNGPSSSAAAGPSSACASPGGASGSGGGGGGAAAAPAQFFRLRAGSEGAVRRGGWGWRNCRVAWEEAVRKENRVERMVARSDPAAAERRLMQRLLVARLEAVSFKGCTGGNSLFEALSLALWGTSLCALPLRAIAVAYAAQHPKEYQCFLGEDFEAYLSTMARPGTPGDELMLRAVADHFGVPINICTSDPFMWFQRYAPVQTRSLREVTLAFLGPCTWMPVRRQSTISALKLTLTGSSDLRAAREMRRRMQQLEMNPVQRA